MSDTCRRLRDVQILFEGQGDEARQRGIIEAGPPGTEVGLALDLPALDALLTEEACRQWNLGRLVVRADRAARQDADTQQKGKRASLGEHDGPFDELNSTSDYNLIWSLVVKSTGRGIVSS